MQYHTNTHGPSEPGFKAGFIKAISEATANGTNQVLLLTDGLQNLQGVISSVLGKAAVKTFEKTREATTGSVTIYLETERIKSIFSKGVIFAPFVSSNLLAVATADYRATDIVYLPWAESELQSYVQNNPASVQL
ncbi:hypothetical protein ED236_07560 [Pseudomethylobacillus aquaticus]|uniref:Uncharacterized protein n=1 Tax=Pseudomethylobacillus aquaticus TaxID=2676064 RepID=A0A3N0V152_9PROT|nr:hypothetical protein [Pseudomethylobacillus aquaticus]ROH86284.1 hypothetical protein ED236_07560 [Pseudomethylobacillus aquaticus]